MYGVELYMGTELNIMDYEGRVDMGEKPWKKWISLLPACMCPV